METQVNGSVNGNRIVFYLDLSFSLVYCLFYLFSCYLLMIKDRRILFGSRFVARRTKLTTREYCLRRG